MRPPRWEYRTLKLDVAGFFGPKVDTAEIEATLNAAGADGWDLVNALPIADSGGRSNAIVAILKRSRDL